ncbi:MAG: DUF115 domain-containing protein [Treponema sp.]|jgi:hypothetical protein|nr:DUF115 domain-containing protein [Treponema sp.]
MSENFSRLHSRYNPQAEAERYIDALNLSGSIEYFILIEPGMGYLIPALQSRCKGSAIIALHADSRFREQSCSMEQAVEGAGIPTWYPDSGVSVQDFLEKEIPDVGAASVRMIEWRPSLAVYGETYLKLIHEAAEFIKRADASYRTTAAFGTRWIKNFFRNLRLIRSALLFKPMDCPLVITGSGPGLEDAAAHISALQDCGFILAASSSLAALAARNIEPDMAISTDGGAWALLHLHSCFRQPVIAHNKDKISGRLPGGLPSLAISLSAALPSQCADIPFLALNDGSLWQSLILNALGIPSLALPQRGTVSASALDLALALSRGSIYLAGMDLSVRDIRSHARPYGFDHLLYGTASRLQPLYSQCFTRSNALRQGGSYAIYAAWFKKQLAAWPGRIFALNGNHAVFDKFITHNVQPGHSRKKWEDHFSAVTISTDAEGRCQQGAQTLIAALDEPQYSSILRKELSPLLFPAVAEAEVSVSEIKQAISNIVCGRTNRG